MAVVALWSSLVHKARSCTRGSSGYFEDFTAWRFANMWDTWDHISSGDSQEFLSCWAVMKRALDRFGQRLQSSLLRFGPRKSLRTNLMMWSDRRLLSFAYLQNQEKHSAAAGQNEFVDDAWHQAVLPSVDTVLERLQWPSGTKKSSDHCLAEVAREVAGPLRVSSSFERCSEQKTLEDVTL